MEETKIYDINSSKTLPNESDSKPIKTNSLKSILGEIGWASTAGIWLGLSFAGFPPVAIAAILVSTIGFVLLKKNKDEIKNTAKTFASKTRDKFSKKPKPKKDINLKQENYDENNKNSKIPFIQDMTWIVAGTLWFSLLLANAPILIATSTILVATVATTLTAYNKPIKNAFVKFKNKFSKNKNTNFTKKNKIKVNDESKTKKVKSKIFTKENFLSVFTIGTSVAWIAVVGIGMVTPPISAAVSIAPFLPLAYKYKDPIIKFTKKCTKNLLSKFKRKNKVPSANLENESTHLNKEKFKKPEPYMTSPQTVDLNLNNSKEIKRNHTELANIDSSKVKDAIKFSKNLTSNDLLEVKKKEKIASSSLDKDENPKRNRIEFTKLRSGKKVANKDLYSRSL